jgi:5-formyltetrahydrofolate cyclo-ligase
MKKETIRKQFIEKRKLVEDKAGKSEIICRKLLNSDLYKHSECIGVYASKEDEVDTTLFITQALEDKKTIVCPRVEGSIMNFYKIKDLKDLSTISSYGVREPKKDANNFVIPSSIDLMIVPGVAFDYEMNRYGYGKGFYDKYLAGLYILKAGICFDEQVSKDNLVGVKDNDVLLDVIYTDKQVITKY